MVHIINSPTFRRPQGFLEITDPDPTKSKGQKAKQEFATITCGHLGELVCVDLSAPEPPTERCRGCGRNICKPCAAEMYRTGKCVTIERNLERWEAGESLMRAVRTG